MVLSPLGDVHERRQTRLLIGRGDTAPVKRDADEANGYPTGLETEEGRSGVFARMRGHYRLGERSRQGQAHPRSHRGHAAFDGDAERHGSAGGRRQPAAARRNIATQTPSFYNVTLKNMAVPWTNRDQTVFAPLNDYVATFIGMVRDDVAFNTALSADLTYTVQRCHARPPRATNNAHYENAETNAVNLFTALHADHAVVDARASRPRPPRVSSPRAPRPRRSSSTAPTARCSASR